MNDSIDITAIDLSAKPRSSRAVVKILEALGFGGVDLWKNRYNKHYVWQSPTLCKFSEETICVHDLRISDWTFSEFLWDFLLRLEGEGAHEDWHANRAKLTAPVAKLKSLLE